MVNKTFQQKAKRVIELPKGRRRGENRPELKDGQKNQPNQKQKEW